MNNRFHEIFPEIFFKKCIAIYDILLTSIYIFSDEADIAELWFEVNKYTPRLSNFKKSSSINVWYTYMYFKIPCLIKEKYFAIILSFDNQWKS